MAVYKTSYYQQSIESQRAFVTPPIIPELEGASNEELKEYLENDDLITDLISKLPIAQKLQKDLENLCNVNEVLASAILAMEEDLEKKKTELEEKRSQFYQLGARWQELQEAHRGVSEKFSPHSIKEHLHAESVVAEEQSEEIVEKFLSKEISVDTFLTQYLDKRTLSHERKAKEDALSKQLKELERQLF